MKKTKNLIWQEEGDSLLDLLKAADGSQATQVRPILHHVVNAYNVGIRSEVDCHAAVIASMRYAASCAAVDGVGIQFHAVCKADEAELIPSGFAGHPVLSRTIRDDVRYSGCKPVPYLFDILTPLRGGEAGEWVVFTNMDIVLQPWFYTSVLEMLQAGFDSLIINRRTQPAEYSGCREWLLRSEIGVSHPGMDCFVFPRSWIDGLVLSDAVVGAGNVMRSLLYNLVCKAKKLAFVTRAMLTLHLGDDRPWMHPPMNSLQEHNSGEALKIWKTLSETSHGNRQRLSDMAKQLPWFGPSVMFSQLHSTTKDSHAQSVSNLVTRSAMDLSCEEVVHQFYQSLLGRDADLDGLQNFSRLIAEPDGIQSTLNTIISSPEFAHRSRAGRRNVVFSRTDLEHEKIIFLHIPKTGGSTLHHLLIQERGDEEICPERYNGLHAFTAAELARYRIFSGHFDYPSTELIPGRKAVITMLREPMSRLVSLYHFQRSHRDEVIERDGLRIAKLARNHSMEEFFGLEEIRNHTSINNAMTRMLSERVPSWRWEGESQKSEPLQPPDRDLALKNLEGLRAYGLMERYQDSVRIICERLSLAVPAEIPRKMVLDEIIKENPDLQIVKKEPMTPKTMELMEGLVDSDREVYDFADNQFSRVCQIREW